MVSVEGGGSKGSAMVQGGFLERPTTRDINVWVINLTREPVSILCGTLLARVTSAIAREEVFCSPSVDGLKVEVRTVITCANNENLDSPDSLLSESSHLVGEPLDGHDQVTGEGSFPAEDPLIQMADQNLVEQHNPVSREYVCVYGVDSNCHLA